MLMSLLKGLMVGFGSVLGASVLVAAFIYILAQISFVPIIGEFVEDIMGQVGSGNVQTEESSDNTFTEQFEEAKKNIEE